MKYLLIATKIALLLLLCWTIAQQLGTWTSIAAQMQLIVANSTITTVFLLLLLLVLSLSNYLIEARRWQFLLQKIHTLSLFQALQSVFAGNSLGIITPNRIGEFGGRVYVLPESRGKALVIMAIGQLAQLLVNLSASSICFTLYTQQQQLLSKWVIQLLLLCSITICLWLIAVYYGYLSLLPKHRYFEPWQAAANLLKSYSTKALHQVLAWSLLRWSVYVLQYIVLLTAFGLSASIEEQIGMVGSIFFAQTCLPTISFVEIGIRGNVALFFGQAIAPQQTTVILLCSMVLWCINLGIPALAGWLFLWQTNNSPSISKSPKTPQK